MKWTDVSYLQDGTPRQREAYAVWRALRVGEVLAPYTPVLAGTIPLAVDIPGSDMDIVCEAHDLEAFARTAEAAYGHLAGFTCRIKEMNGLPSCICKFHHGDMAVELFAQPRPVTKQNAYVHMVVEARLLALAGAEAARSIRRLKESGLKTEPAFAAHFRLEGDPYQALLRLNEATDTELRALVERMGVR